MQASRTIPQAPPLPRPTAPPFWPVAAPCGARPNLAPFPATSSAPRLATHPPRLPTPLCIPETTVPSIPATDGCRREDDTLVSVLNVSVFVFFFLPQGFNGAQVARPSSKETVDQFSGRCVLSQSECTWTVQVHVRETLNQIQQDITLTESAFVWGCWRVSG